MSASTGEAKFEAASVAPESVATHGRKGGSFFVLDPTTGALVVEANLRSKFGNALRREARRLQFRLYLCQPAPYLLKFRLQALRTALQLAGKNAYSLYFSGAPLGGPPRRMLPPTGSTPKRRGARRGPRSRCSQSGAIAIFGRIDCRRRSLKGCCLFEGPALQKAQR
jgi:hypothetical protein